MISVPTAARRAMISSSTRRLNRASLANNHHLKHQRNYVTKKHEMPQNSLLVSKGAGILKSTVSKKNTIRSSNITGNRSLSSSAPPSSKPSTGASSGSTSGGSGKKQKTGSSEIVPNVALATVLFGFVTSVFLYSMNAVGKGDGNAEEGKDPLAQLKAEAQEARESRERSGAGRLSEEEIFALESGVGATEMMMDSDVDAIEEEANRKIFSDQKGEEPKKKKAWWRFGF